MAHAVVMPRQGNSVESCIVGEWMKEEGDAIKAGEVLFTYETDKAAFEEESPADGVMLKRFYAEGDEVPCLATVCIIGEPGEDIGGLAPEESEDTAAPAPEAAEKPETAPAQANTQAAAGDGMRVSPRARQMAERAHIDLSGIAGSGPEGRIIERDVAASAGGIEAEKPAGAGDYTEVPLSNMRRMVGKSMHDSLMNMAQLTLHASFDAKRILAYRKAVKEKGGTNITINDIILYVTARTLIKHPSINAHYMDYHIRQFASAHLGIATDTERGLIVPTLFGADGMGLSELSAAAKALIEGARSGHISPDLLTGGTFTVTNLGVLGVESFTPVINPPQVAILGVCVVKTAFSADGTPYPAMGLSLTFDHRAIDGVPAARFLRELCTGLADFNPAP